ncbi:hypothetical protein POF45_00325 [Pseudomonas sp. 681]|uniref:3-isopropylmalate dehydratase n=1 Tax=Pseudomonas fungipugnans TaxID=3024217 RepID=A0ABT6QG74_9PSED|nr:hypothetical protein [Pseudomonas sp. 681]MDI2589878.1 hypothetical protein [Pseudomonas sp. 681]
MKFIVGALALVALAGCSTSPVPLSQAKLVPKERVFATQAQPAVPFGTIVVARDTGTLGGGCYLAIYLDGDVAARIDTGEVVRFKVPAGDHLIGMGIDKQGGGLCSFTDMLKEQSAPVKSGQVRLFRVSGDQAGFDIRPSSIK